MKYYFLGLFSVIALCIALFSHFNYPSGAWRYRMTVTVDTPEGIKTGSVVREVSVGTFAIPADSGATSYIKMKGEAIVIDLGKQGKLYALLHSDLSYDYARSIFFTMFSLPGMKNGAGSATREGIRYYNQLKNAKADIPLDQPPGDMTHPDYLPKFARFRDVADPRTVERVNPLNLAASYGDGVKLLGIVIETTDDPVTREISKFLPPYDHNPQFHAWIMTKRYGDPLAISKQDFIKE